MAEDKDHLADQQATDRMPAAPPRGTDQAEAKRASDTSGVDDEDPLSAHPT